MPPVFPSDMLRVCSCYQLVNQHPSAACRTVKDMTQTATISGGPLDCCNMTAQLTHSIQANVIEVIERQDSSPRNDICIHKCIIQLLKLSGARPICLLAPLLVLL